MKLFFLSAAQPLTKTFKSDGTKSDYPLVSRFTSHQELVSNSKEFFTVITDHAKKGHCLIKGELTRDLNHESRKDATHTDLFSEWICLDFDRHTAADIDDELTKLNLGDVSYVLQYSSSHGLAANQGTISAHVFIMLSDYVPAPSLKAWLMKLNLTHFRDAIRLSRMKCTLSWPLDITTCQNDKLLYIAPPVFEKPGKDPLQLRITHRNKMFDKLPITRIESIHIAAMRIDERKKLNELRKLEGLPSRVAKTTWIGEIEVHNKPDEATVTGTKDCGEYIRLNLNGGDSWAYWHTKDNFELIHDFKSDTWFKTKELVPGYYRKLVSQQKTLNATPTDTGDLILAFRDKLTATYWNGLWNPAQQNLEIHVAKNETQLDHWLQSHGRTSGTFIPIWTIDYLPKEDWIVDEENHMINTFRFSDYMRLELPEKVKGYQAFPNIHGIIKHVLGEELEDNQISTHWYHWFAAIMQRKFKPTTAWVCHGVEGTGKGFLFNKIITPLLHRNNTISVGIGNLEDNFNDFMEKRLFVLVDEVDVDDFKEKGRMSAKLRSYITEPTMPVRRMRQSAIQLTNWVSFMFSSNRPHPVYIPESDRRYNVANYQSKKLMRPDDKIIESELKAFAEFLLAHQADQTIANSVINTEARQKMTSLGISSVADICQTLLKGDFDKLWISRPDDQLLRTVGVVNEVTNNAHAYNMLMQQFATDWDTTITRDELFIIIRFHVGIISEAPGKFSKMLNHNGIELKQVRKNGRKTYGISVGKWEVSEAILLEVKSVVKQGRVALRRIAA